MGLIDLRMPHRGGITALPLMKRFGSVIVLKPEKADEYRRLHAAVWPEMLRQIKASRIQNYSIYLRQLEDGLLYLFSYFDHLI